MKSSHGELCSRFSDRLSGNDTDRFPYLNHGASRAQRDGAAEALKGLGYRNVPVTVNTHDWHFAKAYGWALRRLERAQRELIAREYLSHVRDRIEAAQRLAHRKLGRDVPHLLLLHANALNADHLGSLLDELKRRGFAFVSVDEALRDPVYKLEDAYVGPSSATWLQRIAPLSKQDFAENRRLEALLQRRFGTTTYE